MLTLVAALVLGAVAAVAIAQTVTVDSNPLRTKGQVAEFHRVSRPGQGTHCSKGLSAKRMRVKIGTGTTECTYSPLQVSSCASPPCNPNFTVIASSALSTKPSRTLRKKLFTSVAVRLTNGGGAYRLDVYSQSKKWKLRRYSTTNNAGNATLLKGNHSVSFIKPPPQFNKLQIKIQQSGAGATLSAWVNGHKVATKHETRAQSAPRGALWGRDSGSANGAIGLFSNFVLKSTF